MTELTAVAIKAKEALVFVDDTRVRWRVDPAVDHPTPSWRCDDCGTTHAPRCAHTAAAAAHIATQLLGAPVEVITKEPTP